MKKGPISRAQAFDTDDRSMVCGVVASPPPPSTGQQGSTLFGVKATRHGAREAGACELPSSSYAVAHPVAQGDIPSLQHLKFRPDLCGQVRRVDCGRGSLDIIVTNSNLGGSLDLNGSPWDRLTQNQPPGITSCSVQLTTRNAFNFDGPRCFYNPETERNNAYYKSVSLLNTQGRFIRSATLNGRPGSHAGSSPYYAFNFGSINDNQRAVFTLEDGSTYSVLLRDGEYQATEQIWS